MLGMIYYSYQKKKTQPQEQVQVAESYAMEQKKTAWGYAGAVVAIIGGLLLFADDIPTMGTGTADDGFAAAALTAGLAYFGIGGATDLNSDNSKGTNESDDCNIY